MLLYYGSAVNGVVASITNFLSFISLLDMGVGAVDSANLTKPFGHGDTDQISRIVVSSERFFRRLAYIFIGYIAVLCVVFPITVNSSFSPWFSISLLIIISISTLAQYLFGMTYQLLLNADQRVICTAYNANRHNSIKYHFRNYTHENGCFRTYRKVDDSCSLCSSAYRTNYLCKNTIRSIKILKL